MPLPFLWLEITGKCQLACEHCYAGSGPTGTHGTLATSDWIRVIDEARQLGVQMIQLIGGEPTLHSDLPVLIRHGLDQGIAVEVLTNLAHVGEKLWKVFALPCLAFGWLRATTRRTLQNTMPSPLGTTATARRSQIFERQSVSASRCALEWSV
ncbi:MAG: radical SAM protein [Pseudonocardiaceae bacterium]